MTDVPAMTFITWSLFCFVKALGSGKRRWLMAGSVLSAFGYGVRFTGVAIPVGLGAFLLFQRKPRFKKSLALLIVTVLPLLFTVGLIWWHSSHTDNRGDLRVIASGANGQSKYTSVTFTNGSLVTVVYSVAPGIFCAPLAVSIPKWSHYKKVFLVLALVMVLFAVGSLTGMVSLQKHGANWTFG